MKEKETTCCFTGHRKLSHPEAEIKERLRGTLIDLIGKGVRTFEAGGAIGFDMIAAETVIELRRVYPEISLCMVLPCRDQCSRWPIEQMRRYKAILGEANEVVAVSQLYTQDCMRMRNYRMVNESSICVCYFDGVSQSGTSQTVAYAFRSGLQVTNVF